MWHPFSLLFKCMLIASILICAIGLPQQLHDDFPGFGAPPKNHEEQTTRGPKRKEEFLDLNDSNICGIPSNRLGTFSINGTFQTHIGGNPWTTAIYTDGRYIAVGTLIRYDVVLTAADPIANITRDQLTVEAGDWDRLGAVEKYSHLSRSVRSIAIHEKLALIILEAPFYSPHISPICVPYPDTVFTEYACRTTGWRIPSVNSSSDDQSDIMWFRNYAVMTHDDCIAELPQGLNMDTNVLCGADLFNEFTPHNPGGGLYCAGQRSVLAGVALSSRGWEPNNQPVLFAKLSNYLDWIMKELP
ncbi:chymotrypsin-like elastase family member 2A [Drosophila eugracilis]|uniref:chymotrypsin-like elastase family member 2A n=1 Tax=Drosophila eugracilis TaxID=29029 RepID=UPI001BD988FE|nr:chymotrypsin-like elastase family member 2A [Drosophila eugracilis]